MDKIKNTRPVAHIPQNKHLYYLYIIRARFIKYPDINMGREI